MNRESIYSALFDQLSAIPGFVTKSRLLKHWVDTPATEQPAMFQAQGKETCITTNGQPNKWELRCQLYVYVRTDGLTPPSTIMNPLLDAITLVVNGRNVINGNSQLSVLIDGVVWARIDGMVETDEGTLGHQAVAIVPITLLVTD